MQNYNAALGDAQFEKAFNIERSELLKKRIKPDKKVIPLVLDYNPILPDIQKIIKKTCLFTSILTIINRDISTEINLPCLL